jgi:hypothetical protein
MERGGGCVDAWYACLDRARCVPCRPHFTPHLHWYMVTCRHHQHPAVVCAAICCTCWGHLACTKQPEYAGSSHRVASEPPSHPPAFCRLLQAPQARPSGGSSRLQDSLDGLGVLAGNLLMNAASWRVVRGQTYCVHCRGSGKEACPSCVGSGIKEPEKVRMNQIRHAGEPGSGGRAGAWWGPGRQAGGCLAVLSMPHPASLFVSTVRVSANKLAIQTSAVPTQHRVLASATYCRCLCGPCMWPGLRQLRGGGLQRTESCGCKGTSLCVRCACTCIASRA